MAAGVSSAAEGKPFDCAAPLKAPSKPRHYWRSEEEPMSRVVVIGGSGHIGTYFVPRLVSADSRSFPSVADSGRRISRMAPEIRAHGHSVPRSRGECRRLRPENPRTASRYSHRHDLLYRSKRETFGRCLARAGAAFPAYLDIPGCGQIANPDGECAFHYICSPEPRERAASTSRDNRASARLELRVDSSCFQ